MILILTQDDMRHEFQGVPNLIPKEEHFKQHIVETIRISNTVFYGWPMKVWNPDEMFKFAEIEALNRTGKSPAWAQAARDIMEKNFPSLPDDRAVSSAAPLRARDPRANSQSQEPSHLSPTASQIAPSSGGTVAHSPAQHLSGKHTRTCADSHSTSEPKPPEDHSLVEASSLIQQLATALAYERAKRGVAL